jgi:glycosyltransferase involved in cell wall biosynthesis
VELVGSVPPEQVIGLLLDHDALLLPSFYEGLPLTLLEAQACGCVPVASRLPGVTDAAVAADQTGFLVPVQSAQGYADALAQLAREPDTWARMSAAGHERAGREFSIARMAEDYRTLIEDALSGRYPLARSRSRGPALDMGLYWRECVPGWAKAVGRRLAGRST